MNWRDAEKAIRGMGLCVSRTGYGRERVIRYRRGSVGAMLAELDGRRADTGYHTDDPVDAVRSGVTMVRWMSERCQRCGSPTTGGESCGCFD